MKLLNWRTWPDRVICAAVGVIIMPLGLNAVSAVDDRLLRAVLGFCVGGGTMLVAVGVAALLVAVRGECVRVRDTRLGAALYCRLIGRRDR